MCTRTVRRNCSVNKNTICAEKHNRCFVTCAEYFRLARRKFWGPAPNFFGFAPNLFGPAPKIWGACAENFGACAEIIWACADLFWACAEIARRFFHCTNRRKMQPFGSNNPVMMNSGRLIFHILGWPRKHLFGNIWEGSLSGPRGGRQST